MTAECTVLHLLEQGIPYAAQEQAVGRVVWQASEILSIHVGDHKSRLEPSKQNLRPTAEALQQPFGPNRTNCKVVLQLLGAVLSRSPSQCSICSRCCAQERSNRL